MNYSCCIRLRIMTILIISTVFGTIIYYNLNKSESEIDIDINKQFSEVVTADLHAAEQNSSDSNSEEFKQLKWFLNKRFWDLRKNSSAAENSNETFFTTSRLLDFQKFSLFRPNSENNKASFFNNDDRITALHVLGMEGLPKDWTMKLKRIYLPNSFSWWNLKDNDHNLTTTGFDGKCASWKINQCILTASKENLEDIDLIVGSARVIHGKTIYYRNKLGIKPEPKYLLHELESPFVESLNIPFERGNVDWLSSYWRGSDITTPYDRYEYYDLRVIKRPQGIINGRTTNEYRKLLGVKPRTKFLYYELESPYIEPLIIPLETANIDWLSSYWRGSDITSPYARWEYYDLNVTKKPQEKNYAKGKTKFGAIFVSNCYSKNGRIHFINKLQAMIQIDMYGQCGTFTCGRENHQQCFDKLREEYKFYFAFENTNCREYITEKFFINALMNDVIPVVFGAHPDDYKLAAPANSYIHVEDFDTTEELVNYLKYLDSNDTAYNSYFEWKGTGQFIDTKYFCRVCTMLHYHDYLMHNMEDRANNNNNEVFQLTPITWNPLSQCSHGVFWKMKMFL